MKLYHGTNADIDATDLNRGMLHKDFGKGFYLTSVSVLPIFLRLRARRGFSAGHWLSHVPRMEKRPLSRALEGGFIAIKNCVNTEKMCQKRKKTKIFPLLFVPDSSVLWIKVVYLQNKFHLFKNIRYFTYGTTIIDSWSICPFYTGRHNTILRVLVY